MATIPLPQRRVVIKPIYLIGIAMIVLAVVLGYNGLQQSFRPYTTKIDEAIVSGRSVQLQGFLGSKGAYDANGKFTFDLQDSSGKMVKVVYSQPKPSNFEQAISIVAIGHYDEAQKVFIADEMLVKCPSKYQEQANTQ
ncbi:MAG: cytochrome c maturation protein CcmE [Roseiflexaceae bacterium]|mgnify:CR=1 FL=1|nr:cytochrome c maturation protein CcmE [Roseiflexaceae bacterium]